MPSEPLERIREQIAAVGDDARIADRDFAASGFHREVTCPAELIVEVAKAFRDAEYFLEMMAATDSEGNATVCYTFNRWGSPDRTLVRVDVGYDDPVPSISSIFPGALWNEREAFEMVGVRFEGHPNLVRLLLPEDADFFPLRKDFGIPAAIRNAREKYAKKQARAKARKAAARKKAAEKEPAGSSDGESGQTDSEGTDE